ncbi:MAG: hypothetical protein FJ319_11395 [SAR202 cluster bacterium]|nr:hypothetical protein [SAR202 cluster bacterium]
MKDQRTALTIRYVATLALPTVIVLLLWWRGDGNWLMMLLTVPLALFSWTANVWFTFNMSGLLLGFYDRRKAFGLEKHERTAEEKTKARRRMVLYFILGCFVVSVWVIGSQSWLLVVYTFVSVFAAYWAYMIVGRVRPPREAKAGQHGERNEKVDFD